jgi:hypothetical protein
MECAKCGKPYMIGLVFRYTKEGFLLIDRMTLHIEEKLRINE